MNDHTMPASLNAIAHRVMLERGLQPDFSREAKAQLATITRPAPASGPDMRSAPHGSSAAPVRPSSAAEFRIAAGAALVPVLPRNAARSPLTLCCRPAKSMNATRSPNSARQALRAKSAPVLPSIDVTMYGVALAPLGASAHSTYAVSVSERGPLDRLRSRRRVSLTLSCGGTHVVDWMSIPWSGCGASAHESVGWTRRAV